MEKKHYYGIDWIRMLACIGIVMMHMAAPINNDYAISGVLYETVIPSFTNFVYIFMVISAFGMCVGYYDKLKSGKINWSQFYKKRYIKVLPFFSLLVLISIIMEPSLSNLIEGFADVTLLFGLFPNSITVIGVGWFLGLIFAFYMIFPFFCTLIDNKRVAWISFCLSMLFSLVGASYFSLGRTNIVYCLPFFLAGGLIYLYRDTICKHNWYFYTPIVVISVSCYFGFDVSLCTCLFVSATAVIMAIADQGSYNRFISFFSGISMEIYLSHMVIFRAIAKMHLNTRFGNGWLQYLITLGIVLGGTIAFSTVVKKTIHTLEKIIHAK